MTTSGSTAFSLSNADILLESFDIIELRPPAITAQHMVSARRSINLELQSWQNTPGVNLWTVDLLTFPLQQGVLTYNIPPDTITLLDTYIRQYSVTTPFNVAPDFSIVSGSALVTIIAANYGLVTGQWVNITIPVAIGNLLLYGYYQLTQAIDVNTFTITAAVKATSTIAHGGALPIFTSTAGSSNISVSIPNHGLVAGDTFNVAVQTSVGGVILLGANPVLSVADASHFTISTYQTAVSTATVTENNGLEQFMGQTAGVDPIDYIMTPLGRTDYAQIPDKAVQARPTTYWFNRQINPNITMWQVPDQNGPYELRAYRMRQIQDANYTMGQTPDIPYRALDALCKRLAYRLAMKYAKPMMTMLKGEADMAMSLLQTSDVEDATIMILPSFEGYYVD